MNLDNRVKSRKLKRNILNFLNFVKLRSINLDTWSKIVLFWWIIIFFSLFFNWIESINNSSLNWNSFSSLNGISWIIIIISILYLFFNTFSITKKEKLKQYSKIYITNYKVSILVWVFSILLATNSLYFISALRIFELDIIHGKWIILALTWWVITIIWWVIQVKTLARWNQDTFYNYDSYSSQKSEKNIWEDDEENNKDNMRLPI